MGDGFELAQGMSFNFLRVGGMLTGEYDGPAEGNLVGRFGGEDSVITYAAGLSLPVMLAKSANMPSHLFWHVSRMR